MNPWINYHHLYYFKTIAEAGTVSRAAEELSLGQPTLSAQLKQFEENIGIQLFERQHKKLILTEHGQVALDYARSIFKLGSEMVEALHDRLQPTRPSLHIASLDSVPKQIVMRLVQKALKLTDCQVTLSEGSLDQIVRELASHRVDILVTNTLPIGPSAKGLYPKKVTKKNVGFYGTSKFKKLIKGFPKSLANQPLLLPTYDSKMRYDLDHWAKLQKIPLNIVVESQDIAMKKLLAINGLGLMPTATHTIQQQVLAGELMEIGVARGISEELYLIVAERKLKNPLAQEVYQNFTV